MKKMFAFAHTLYKTFFGGESQIQNMKFNTVELYAGTGRSIEPFRRWKNVGRIALIDNNPYARNVYQFNYPDVGYRVLDLNKDVRAEILRAAGAKVDILLGCPPCQGFSDCGSKNGRDSRNRHVSRFHAIVRDLRPRVLAMENVPLVVKSGRFRQFVTGLEQLGYVWTAAVANAALWGSCQSRQRLILIAACKELRVQPEFPAPTHGGKNLYFSYSRQSFCRLDYDLIGMLGQAPAAQRTQGSLPHLFGQQLGAKPVPTVRDTIGDLPSVSGPSAKRLHHVRWKHSSTVLRRMANVPEGERWRGGVDHYSQAYGRLHRLGLARTITGYFPNAGSGRFWHPTENRALTLREAARIQGFPDEFQFLDNDSENCTLVGNALDRALSNLVFDVVSRCL